MKTTIDMAREVYGAHTEWSGAPLDRLEQLVALVRADERNKQGEAFQQILSSVKACAIADEREACAKVCDEESNDLGGVAEGPFVTDFGKHTHMSMAAGAQNCAAAIRNRGNI